MLKARLASRFNDLLTSLSGTAIVGVVAKRSDSSPNGTRSASKRHAKAGDGELTFTTTERAHAARVVDIVGPIIPALAAALAPRTEVVLHDLTRMPNTIAAIGGSITGRDTGGPPTDLGLRVFRAEWREHLVNYRTETDGLVMRSSSLFFYARSGKPVACICINADISALSRAREVLEALTTMSTDDPLGENTPSPDATESFPDSVDALVEGILAEAIAAVDVPITLMKKHHKIEVVRELERRGFFTIREAADIAAKHLAVSRFTVYNYLNEIQAQRST